MKPTHDSPKCSRLLNANKRLALRAKECEQALRAVMDWWLNSIDGKTEDDEGMPPAIFDNAMTALRGNGNDNEERPVAMAGSERWPSRGLL